MEGYEHIFNEINFYASISKSKERLKNYQEELRKLYLEVLYETNLKDDSKYTLRRYLLEYYGAINKKINRRIKEVEND